MFTGEHPLSIDDKGRLAVPARFRQLLAETQGSQLFIVPIVAADKPAHLEIYPKPEFERLAGLIDALQDRAAADRLKLGFIGRAAMVEMDAQGRVTLPQKHREHAKLNGRVMVLGQLKRFDVWDEAIYTELSGEPADLAADLALIPR